MLEDTIPFRRAIFTEDETLSKRSWGADFEKIFKQKSSGLYYNSKGGRKKKNPDLPFDFPLHRECTQSTPCTLCDREIPTNTWQQNHSFFSRLVLIERDRPLVQRSAPPGNRERLQVQRALCFLSSGAAA